MFSPLYLCCTVLLHAEDSRDYPGAKYSSIRITLWHVLQCKLSRYG